MPRQKLIIILIILLIAVIIIAGIFWFLNIQKNKSQQGSLSGQQNSEQVLQELGLNNEQNSSKQELGANNEENNPAPYVPKATEQEKLQAQLTKIASAFTERFGSYSNQSNYENLKDLLLFMTPTFKRWTEDKIASADVTNKPAIYYGITTKVLKTDLIDFSQADGIAVFVISTQRNEVVGSSENSKALYQNMNLQMVETNGVWKVSQATWE
ncbi:hypothetical protein L6278_01880 [Candidatus Parcubacteria bacterium]|nr:hypothetical protein [Patescibacteria group bacterium]MCG2686868.1 hypothetical protein [Candidatus Parcubacteria bacterium]